MRKHPFFRRHPGEGTPMILAIVLVLLMLFCTVAEFSRVWIIAQGVKEAAQQAVMRMIRFVLSFIDFPPFSDLSLDWTIPHLSA